MALGIFGIAFVAYNVLLFVICGFAYHGASFWISYVFMLLAFAVVAACGYFFKRKDPQAKDWFLGYPLFRHRTAYIISEAIASVVFIALDYVDCPWWIAFSVQFILLVAHLIVIISSFMAKEAVEEVQVKVKAKTSKIKLLQIDAEMVAESTNNTEVKENFIKLAEQIRYSDPMSNDALSDLEEQIAYTITQAKTSVSMNDSETALSLCRKATLLLTERNKKCKVLK